MPKRTSVNSQKLLTRYSVSPVSECHAGGIHTGISAKSEDILYRKNNRIRTTCKKRSYNRADTDGYI